MYAYMRARLLNSFKEQPALPILKTPYKYSLEIRQLTVRTELDSRFILICHMTIMDGIRYLWGIYLQFGLTRIKA